MYGTIDLSYLHVIILFLLLKDSVLHLQEEMTRLQENLEKLKVQGSEDDSEEKVTSNKRLELIIRCVTFSSYQCLEFSCPNL